MIETKKNKHHAWLAECLIDKIMFVNFSMNNFDTFYVSIKSIESQETHAPQRLRNGGVI